MSNPYYDPERYGATIVVASDWISLGYEFDMFAVWRRADGALVLDTDSGCSCPTPFDGTNLYALAPMTKHEVVAELQSLADNHYSDGPELRDNLARAIETIMKES